MPPLVQWPHLFLPLSLLLPCRPRLAASLRLAFPDFFPLGRFLLLAGGGGVRSGVGLKSAADEEPSTGVRGAGAGVCPRESSALSTDAGVGDGIGVDGGLIGSCAGVGGRVDSCSIADTGVDPIGAVPGDSVSAWRAGVRAVQAAAERLGASVSF